MGVNINPYVAVRVGDQRRVTTTQRGTNCPFYNEVSVIKEECGPERMGGGGVCEPDRPRPWRGRGLDAKMRGSGKEECAGTF